MGRVEATRFRSSSYAGARELALVSSHCAESRPAEDKSDIGSPLP